MKYLTHAWAASLEVRHDDESDGRTLVGLAVPYDTPLDVTDLWETYTEVFRRGSFRKTIRDRARPVPLLVHHEHRGLPIGHATDLTETDAGLEAEFHLAPTARADEVLALITDGALGGLSVGFEPMQHRTTPGHRRDPASHLDLVERTEVSLREVSVCNFPAYAGAGVTGVREDSTGHPSLASLAAERGRLHTRRSTALDQWGRVVRR